MFDRRRDKWTLVSFVGLALACGLAAAAAEPPPADWLQKVKTALTEQEYEVTWQSQTDRPGFESAWHAPNRVQGFRTYFAPSGPRVIPREQAVSWEWSLELVGYGRGGTSWSLPPASLRPSQNRIDYERGVVTEWYENSPRGLKQGFVLYRSPEESAGALPGGASPPRVGPVHLDLRLDGTLEPTIAEDGGAVDFHAGGGVNILRYAEILVTDAGGRELPAWIEGFSGEGFGGLRIVFEDEGAAYPVTVDPLTTSPSWTAESNQDLAGFGFSVATAGDVNGDGFGDVIVGAPYFDSGETNEGRVYVYHGSAAGLSAGPAWTKEGNQLNANFGFAVSAAGDVNGDGFGDVIIGAPYMEKDQPDEGIAAVYLGSSSGLALTSVWTAEGNQNFALFGFSVAAAGDVNGDHRSDVIVGARDFDNIQTDEGRAFVYHGTPSGVSTGAAWTAESNQNGAWFGYAVAWAGDVNADGFSDVIVGASRWDTGPDETGRAYAYFGSLSGLSFSANWVKDGPQPAAQFGASVATAGDVNGDGFSDVIVGAPYYDAGQTDEGRAFVYYGSASGISIPPSWTNEINQNGANYGMSVASAGDINGDGYADVIVGASGYDVGVLVNAGRAYVYLGSVAGLRTTYEWTADSGQSWALYGNSVASAGDVNGDGYSDVLVGANFFNNPETDEGRAFVYHGSPSGIAKVAEWTNEGNQVEAWLGVSVATAGDVNGDGYADVIVGAEQYDNGQTDEGKVFVFHGTPLGPSAGAAWSAEANLVDAKFGTSVATAGDVNGDGYSDVIIGAPNLANPELQEGRAYVYHGSASGLATSPAWTFEGNLVSVAVGASVGTAGDVNGDGWADVIVGAPLWDNVEGNEGRAFVFLGSATGVRTTPAWTAESNQAQAQFGCSVSTAGDTNGDGYSDVIVGACYFDNPELNEGRAYVYNGSSSGLDPLPWWTRDSNQANSEYGHSVATAGDVNGDGFSDVIVGARLYDNPEVNEGRAYVYHGSASGLSLAAAWTRELNLASSCFGSAVSSAGDVNGDGFSDVIVGAECYSNPEPDEGAAFVYHGSSAGLATTAGWSFQSNQEDTWFGSAVASAGDVNGDGYADVIVGARLFDGPEKDEGKAFLFYGGGGRGIALRPQQRRVSNTALIGHLGVSDDPNRFRLASLGRTPYGRGRVKLEWEVKPLGTPLNGTGTSISSTFLDTTGPGPNELVTGLSYFTPHHWRVRLRYETATNPFLQRSRWLTIPRNGWQEEDLRTGALFP